MDKASSKRMDEKVRELIIVLPLVLKKNDKNVIDQKCSMLYVYV